MAIYLNNNETITLHLTKRCNLRCGYCYQKDYEPNDMSKDLIDEAIRKLNPKYVMLYGGEPFLKPGLLDYVMDKYDVGVATQTNGTMLHTPTARRIIEHGGIIFVTLESYDYDRQIVRREMSREQFNRIIDFLREFGHTKRAIPVKNIYAESDDIDKFYKMTKLAGTLVDLFPIVDMTVTDSYKYVKNLPPEVVRFMVQKHYPTVMPKLRVLTDGTVTRDMRGVYNIGHISEYKDCWKNGYLLPISTKCRECRYFQRCFACNIFPHFVKDSIEQTNEILFCCGLTRSLHENYRF